MKQMVYEYIGQELELFKYATNWKNYSFSQFLKYVSGDVLEVGAGIGTNTMFFLNFDITFNTWTATEIDHNQVDKLRQLKHNELLSTKHIITQSYVRELESQTYDTVLYIDVLEHIEDDRQELEEAYRVLKPGGHLIVLCPAHNWLFSPFDKSIGHFRRYNKQMYLDILPKGFKILKINYLDAIGTIASTANKLVLKKKYPTIEDVKFWDKVIVPLSKIVDSIFRYRMGKSVLLVAKK